MPTRLAEPSAALLALPGRRAAARLTEPAAALPVALAAAPCRAIRGAARAPWLPRRLAETAVAPPARARSVVFCSTAIPPSPSLCPTLSSCTLALVASSSTLSGATGHLVQEEQKND